MTKALTPFETETCGRCGGSGHYSRCQMWGTHCFDCGSAAAPGSGRRLTKRGAAARAFYRSLRRTKAVEALVVGEVACEVGGQAGRFTVAEAPVVTEGGVRVAFKKVLHYFQPGATVVLPWPTAEEREAAVALALAYQATLTKEGKPTKRAKRTEVA